MEDDLKKIKWKTNSENKMKLEDNLIFVVEKLEEKKVENERKEKMEDDLMHNLKKST
jgi:HD superfamily phosphohydrolase YqeK